LLLPDARNARIERTSLGSRLPFALPAQPGNLLDGNTPLVADRANRVQFVRFFPSVECPDGNA
jgi:hypothetical protein